MVSLSWRRSKRRCNSDRGYRCGYTLPDFQFWICLCHPSCSWQTLRTQGRLFRRLFPHCQLWRTPRSLFIEWHHHLSTFDLCLPCPLAMTAAHEGSYPISLPLSFLPLAQCLLEHDRNSSMSMHSTKMLQTTLFYSTVVQPKPYNWTSWASLSYPL